MNYLDIKKDIASLTPENKHRLRQYLDTLLAQQSDKMPHRDVDNSDHYLFVLRDYLQDKGVLYPSPLPERIQERREGKSFTMRDHVNGMVYSMLSNQTKWIRIQPHLAEIDELFYNYDPDRLLAADPQHLEDGLRQFKCGNRAVHEQMLSIGENIKTFQKIEVEYGSIDAFISSMPPAGVAKAFYASGSPYKLKQLGEALVWEYLRNVGIDACKPDVHVRTFLGADRMGTGSKSPASLKDTYAQIDLLVEETGLLRVDVDAIIWSFCADGYGEVCTADPKCTICPIKSRCKYNA